MAKNKNKKTKNKADVLCSPQKGLPQALPGPMVGDPTGQLQELLDFILPHTLGRMKPAITI